MIKWLSLLVAYCMSQCETEPRKNIWNGRQPIRYRNKTSFVNVANIIPVNTKMVYYTGPLISYTSTVVIFWGSKVAYSNEIKNFYTDIFNTSWFDILSEYSINGYNLTSGNLIGTYNYTSSYQSGNIMDSSIKSILLNLVVNKLVQQANYYAIHFAPGISIQLDEDYSCQDGGFCAYHNTLQNGNDFVYYGVIPDQSALCSTGCGTSYAPVNNLHSVMSHELSEAITDSAVGFATVYGYPLGWYSSMAENADMCNGYQGITTSRNNNKNYTVQYIFSNKQGGCVFSAIAPISPQSTMAPTPQPTMAPTPQPTMAPTPQPTMRPTPQPTMAPTPQPTMAPTPQPTMRPTSQPTMRPTSQPTVPPTVPPTIKPTVDPYQGSCPHSPCRAGVKMPATCSTCSYQISLRDPNKYCSTRIFDYGCVALAKQHCPGLPCP